ncbi:MAG: 30S ribosomal protein S1 [Fidelibacterota bacterium]
MSEIEQQEPVAEQAEIETAITVSAEAPSESASATFTEESTETAKKDLNYLSSDLFSDIRTVNREELLDSEVQEEISETDKEKYLSTFSDISEHQIVTGRVIGTNDKDVLIDIGFKSEGIIDRDEFPADALPKVGDKLDVYLEYIEDESGKTVLSKEKADFLQRWRELREIYEQGTNLTGHIQRRIKGGMVVDLDGVQAFLPGSQIDVRPVQNFDQFVDQDMEFRVVKLNEFRKNIVVSHKAILEESLAEQRESLFKELEVGKVVEGRVKNITDFGVFIDLGGIDGLLHITDLSWGRVNHPSEVVQMDETLTVKIIDFDEEKKRVSLGLKQLTPHPWEHVQDKYPEGTRIKGKVVSMTNYGAFVEIEPGVEGLIHVSEMSWTHHVKNPSEIFNLGDEVEAVVLSIDTEERKISLGAKQLQPDPWDEIEDKYMVGTVVKGKVINLTQFGAFVELEEGIDGLIHVSDLSWTKIVRHPREIIEKGQEAEVRVLEVSRESRRIALGLKQVEEDPWPEIIKHFETGKEVEGEIIRVLDKGIILQLELDVEGIVPLTKQTKRQRKALISKYKAGQKLSAVVMEVKPEEKKVILYMEELGKQASGPKDEVQEYLANQEAPAAEKIEIPDNSSESAAEAPE